MYEKIEKYKYSYLSIEGVVLNNSFYTMNTIIINTRRDEIIRNESYNTTATCTPPVDITIQHPTVIMNQNLKPIGESNSSNSHSYHRLKHLLSVLSTLTFIIIIIIIVVTIQIQFRHQEHVVFISRFVSLYDTTTHSLTTTSQSRTNDTTTTIAKQKLLEEEETIGTQQWNVQSITTTRRRLSGSSSSSKQSQQYSTSSRRLANYNPEKCENSSFKLVQIQSPFFRFKWRRNLFCFMIRSTERCKAKDFLTNKEVAKSCPKQCPGMVSGCTTSGGGTPTPPIPAPIKPSPSPAIKPNPSPPIKPIQIPPTQLAPPPIPVLIPPTISAPPPISYQPPMTPVTINYPVPPPMSYPTFKAPVSYDKNSDEFITHASSSEVVTIPRPPLPSTASLSTQQVNCPHAAKNVKNWMNPSTWPNGKVPNSQFMDVILPENSRVLMDHTISATVFGIITIPASSELILGTSNAGTSVNLNLKGMEVSGGKLTVGSESCRIVPTSPVTITLYGRRPTDAVTNIPQPSVKGIHVTDGGTLNLHGQQYYPTWSRLARTINPGDTTLYLQEKVYNWYAGQEIIIATSSMKDSRDFNLNEVHTIKSISSTSGNPSSTQPGTTITLSAPLEYLHTANRNYQVEVGLLSRSIKIQGSESDSPPTDTTQTMKSGGGCTTPNSNSKGTRFYGTTQPCMNEYLTGYGGHVMISKGAYGYIEGIELQRMGQTNVVGRYPIHFHLLGDTCQGCYFRDNSIRESYYRCISIHATNQLQVNNNVAYDIIGYCYYLEDGIEIQNTLSYNFVAHIHSLGPDIQFNPGHQVKLYHQSTTLSLPADITASGFYITNVQNNIIGNAVSGGWSGFAFPSLRTPLQTFQSTPVRPTNAVSMVIDGNTAHSSGWWWVNAGAFYLGGALYYSGNKLVYNPGRTKEDVDRRNPCSTNTCVAPYNDCSSCPTVHQSWLRITNTKVFLTAAFGMTSWTGRVEIFGFESHDTKISFQALSPAFQMSNALAVCRTGLDVGLPNYGASNGNKMSSLEGTGFVWYDTNQKHIMTNLIFRNCGYRSDQFNQYDKSPTRGCSADDPLAGCSDKSSVFVFTTLHDVFTPEIMQATRNVQFQNCGRRFAYQDGNADTVSGRHQNWIDADGSVSGLKVPTIIGSGVDSAARWWGVEDNVVYDPQGPLRFIQKTNGPDRELAFLELSWDEPLHIKVGEVVCGANGELNCKAEGYVRHAGKKFSPSTATPNSAGLPITAKGDIVGLSGGFGWIMNFLSGAPRSLQFKAAEINPASKLLISILYPPGSTVTVTAHAQKCQAKGAYTCMETFQSVSSIEEVRRGPGNTYHFDSGNGVLTFRLAQLTSKYTGNPNWSLPNYSTPAVSPDDVWSLGRYERDGILLPRADFLTYYQVQVKCPSDPKTNGPKNGYCPQKVNTDYNPDVCANGFIQVAYDRCCQSSNLKNCIYANGSKNF